MIRNAALLALLCLATAGCASHALDCDLGATHTNCRPGTKGYRDPNTFAAADDQQCRSFGMLPGTSPYEDCRLTLSKPHAATAKTSPAP